MRNKGFVKLGINGTTSIESVKTQAASTSECPPPKKTRSHTFGLVLESRYIERVVDRLQIWILEIFYKVYKPMELNRAHTPINTPTAIPSRRPQMKSFLGPSKVAD
jgi:hypothetical protein